MKKTITKNDIAETLRNDTFGGWSYYGAEAMAEYLEEYEESTEEELELDAVAIRCDFTEYENAVEAAGDMGWVADYAEDEEGNLENALKYLENNTTVIPFSTDNPLMNERTSGVIIQNF